MTIGIRPSPHWRVLAGMAAFPEMLQRDREHWSMRQKMQLASVGGWCQDATREVVDGDAGLALARARDARRVPFDPSGAPEVLHGLEHDQRPDAPLLCAGRLDSEAVVGLRRRGPGPRRGRAVLVASEPPFSGMQNHRGRGAVSLARRWERWMYALLLLFIVGWVMTHRPPPPDSSGPFLTGGPTTPGPSR